MNTLEDALREFDEKFTKWMLLGDAGHGKIRELLRSVWSAAEATGRVEERAAVRKRVEKLDAIKFWPIEDAAFYIRKDAVLKELEGK